MKTCTYYKFIGLSKQEYEKYSSSGICHLKLSEERLCKSFPRPLPSKFPLEMFSHRNKVHVFREYLKVADTK